MKLSVFTVSLPEWTPEQTVDRLAELGCEGVEWRIQDDPASTDPTAAEPGFWSGNRATWPFTGLEDRIPEMVELTRSRGLEISGLIGYVPVSDRVGAEHILRATAAAGSTRTRLQMPQLGSGPYRELFAETREHLEHLEPLAKELGVTILVELHHGTITASASAGLRLLDGLDPTAVGTIHDLGNLVIQGWEDPAAGLEILGPYLAHVHLKNARFVSEDSGDGVLSWHDEWAPLRTGIADVAAYVRTLVEHGYDGWIALEDFSTEPPQDGRTADNVAYVSRLLEDAGARRG